MIEVVGNHNDGEAFIELLESFIELLFRTVVEVIGWFIKDKELFTGDDGAGEENFLTLTTREITKTFIAKILNVESV